MFKEPMHLCCSILFMVISRFINLEKDFNKAAVITLTILSIWVTQSEKIIFLGNWNKQLNVIIVCFLFYLIGFVVRGYAKKM